MLFTEEERSVIKKFLALAMLCDQEERKSAEKIWLGMLLTNQPKAIGREQFRRALTKALKSVSYFSAIPRLCEGLVQSYEAPANQACWKELDQIEAAMIELAQEEVGFDQQYSTLLSMLDAFLGADSVDRPSSPAKPSEFDCEGCSLADVCPDFKQ